jgi:hypothetical protein
MVKGDTRVFTEVTFHHSARDRNFYVEVIPISRDSAI